MRTNTHRSSAAFTLVELLVVIVIIATLAALSLVGFSRMRAAGDRAATISTLRQLQVANMTYATENNGQFVPIAELDANDSLAMEWYKNPKFLCHLTSDPGVFEKKGDELLIAPVGSLDPVAYRAKKRYYDRLPASFGINAEGLSWPKKFTDPPMSYRITQIENPGRTAFLVTAVNYQVKHAGRNLWKQNPVEGKVTTDKMAFRHGNKAAVVYYDGSSGFVTYADIARFDASGGASNPFWKALK